MPGAAALSSASFCASASRRDSVVRKPAIAGPKPTQAMSTAMDCRSMLAPSLDRVVERLGDHHLRERLGRAVLREVGAGDAAVELGAERPEVGRALAAGARPLLVRVGVGRGRTRAELGEDLLERLHV